VTCAFLCRKRILSRFEGKSTSAFGWILVRLQPAAPEGAIDIAAVAASLKRCPDTNRAVSDARLWIEHLSARASDDAPRTDRPTFIHDGRERGKAHLKGASQSQAAEQARLLPGGGVREKSLFRPAGACLFLTFSHGLRRGLHSYAASRLTTRNDFHGGGN